MDENGYEGISRKDLPEYLEDLRMQFSKGQLSQAQCKTEFGILSECLGRETQILVATGDIQLTDNLLDVMVDLSQNFDDMFTIKVGADVVQDYLSAVITCPVRSIKVSFPPLFITETQNHYFELIEKCYLDSYRMFLRDLSYIFLHDVDPDQTQLSEDYLELLHTKVVSYITKNGDYDKAKEVVRVIYNLYIKGAEKPGPLFEPQAGSHEDPDERANPYPYSLMKMFIKKMYSLYKSDPKMKIVFDGIREDKVIDLDSNM